MGPINKHAPIQRTKQFLKDHSSRHLLMRLFFIGGKVAVVWR